MTWNEADPVDLPSPPLANRLIGFARMVLVILVTLIMLVPFLLGRVLRKMGDRWLRLDVLADRIWARIGVWLLGLKLEVRGRPIESGALVANHSSWSDIPVLRAVRWIYFVSKADVARWPGVGFLASAAGTIFIERRRVEAKRQEEILRQRIAANQLLCFFPEGTSTDGLRVLPFKSSLFSVFFGPDVDPAIWVQPVSIRYLTAPGSALPESFFGWWGTMPFGGHMRTVMQFSFGSRVVVTFHEPVHPSDFSDRKALSDHSQAAVAEGHAAAASSGG
ncbi:MAG: 1-acyl-sn-glycerol-3-phosphate acyltransferase [Pseudomonadota bacterium]